MPGAVLEPQEADGRHSIWHRGRDGRTRARIVNFFPTVVREHASNRVRRSKLHMLPRENSSFVDPKARLGRDFGLQQVLALCY